MATKKAKAAKKKKRRPSRKVWELPQFKALLSDDGCMTCSGIKIMVENQRDINTKLYQSIEAAIEAIQEDRQQQGKRSSALTRALALVREVPGSGPPECKDDPPGGG